MKKHVAKSFAAVAVSVALCATVTGCSSLGLGGTTTTTTSGLASQYISQVNQITTTLDSDLEAFAAAVASGDAEQIRTQAEAASKDVDQIKSIEVADVLKDVKEKYDNGCTALKDALDQYVTLYESGQPVTAEALQAIQSRYQEGVNALTEADKAAAEIA